MRKSVIATLLGSVLALSGCGSSTEAAADAPNAVKKAATTLFGKNAKLSYEKEGNGLYEVGASTEIEAVFDEQGNVRETEVEIPLATLPMAVLAAVRAKLPSGAKLVEAEVVIKPTGVAFEVEAAADGKEIEYVVSPTGDIVGQEQDDDVDDDDDDDS